MIKNSSEKYVDVEFDHLPEEELLDYRAFLVGNDPNINGLEHYSPKLGGIAIVSTSGFRVLKLACELGVKDTNHIPKIYLVEISKEVHEVWGTLKEMITLSSEEFLSNLSIFLKKQANISYRKFEKFQCNCDDCEERPSQNEVQFFDQLITSYSYDYLREIIVKTRLIKQSFAHADTFLKIKKDIEYLGIKNTFVFPSNIISEIYWLRIKSRSTIDSILKNIELLALIISIHTNICRKHFEPKKTFLIADQTPSNVKTILKLGSSRKAPTQDSYSDLSIFSSNKREPIEEKTDVKDTKSQP